MSTAFLRRVRATIWKPEPGPDSEFGAYFGQPVPGSTVVEGLRIQFTVEKDDKTTANTATVTISNLAQRTREEFADIPRRMILEAGYGDSLATIFVGDITAPPKGTYGSTDIDTEILGKDGGRALKHAHVSKAYRGTATALQLAQDAIKALGLRVPADLPGYQELSKQYPHGTSLHGLASDRLTQILKPLGFEWSIQNGQIVVVKAGGVLDGDELVINTQAGMVGSPQRRRNPCCCAARS